MPPAFGSQRSSFNQTLLGPTPFAGATGYFDNEGLDNSSFEFSGIGSGFEHDLHHSSDLFRPDEDDHEEFGALMNNRSKSGKRRGGRIPCLLCTGPA